MEANNSEYCFDQLKANMAVISSAENSNEATTRLRAIDTIIFDVLKWNKSDIETEKYCREAGIADYVFFHGKSPCMVLEAKRSEIGFLLPQHKYGNEPVSFSLLAKESKEAASALEQAAGYANNLGARFVSISNGWQWLVALTFVPDQMIHDRLVYVFESLPALESKFRLFHRCFSSEHIFSNAIIDDLLDSRRGPAPPKHSSQILNYPCPSDRNVIVNELGYSLSFVWDEMGQDEENEYFLRECYVRPRDSSNSFDMVKTLLQKREGLDVAQEAQIDGVQDVKGLMANYEAEKPIVVLGGIGHGKTTFLRHLRLIDAKKEFSRYIQIDINLLDRPDRESQVQDFIYAEIERQLLDRYNIDIMEDGTVRGSLHGEIARFRKGPLGTLLKDEPLKYKEKEVEFIEKFMGNKHDYFTKVFYHLKKGQRYSLAIFLDNLDRREKGMQEAAFLIASSIARDWSALVFICLRPDTFYESREKGVLDSIAPRIINVTSPDTRILLTKRFRFAKTVAESAATGTENAIIQGLGQKAAVLLPTVADFFECCIDSLNNKELLRLFTAVSCGNMRNLLVAVREILTSTQLNTKKILKKQYTTGYRIPEHEATFALLYRNYEHYDPRYSQFVNLFDIDRADSKEHFTKFLLLNYLARFSEDSRSDGYCSINKIEMSLNQIGYTRKHIQKALTELYDKKYCSSKIPDVKWDNIQEDLRITSLGKYHINVLVNKFQYFDAVVIDTPITDETARSQISDAKNISDRLSRAKVFLEYLDKSATKAQFGTSRELWFQTSNRVRNEIKEIEKRIESPRTQ